MSNISRKHLHAAALMASTLFESCSTEDGLYCVSALEVTINALYGFTKYIGTEKSLVHFVAPMTSKFSGPEHFERFLCGDSVLPVVLQAKRVQHSTCMEECKHMLAACGVAAVGGVGGLCTSTARKPAAELTVEVSVCACLSTLAYKHLEWYI